MSGELNGGLEESVTVGVSVVEPLKEVRVVFSQEIGTGPGACRLVMLPETATPE